MAVALKIQAVNILQWSRYLNEVPKRTRPAIAKAMNEYGDGVANSAAEAIATATGLDVHEVRALIDVEEATAENLTWRMDATQAAPPPQDWTRPWDSRSGKPFEPLVKIVTMGDHVTCEVCEEAAANSPYTMDEINNLAAKWQHWEPPAGVVGERTNLIHPNCRCAIQPWKSERKVAVSFGTGKAAPVELLNARQLGRKVADELRVTIRAIKP